MRHQWSDAWLLLAIVRASANGKAGMQEIIEAGDGINHAIFTDEELEGGLARLTAAGLIKEKNGVFFPSRAVKKELSQTGSRRSIQNQLKEAERVLGLT